MNEPDERDDSKLIEQAASVYGAELTLIESLNPPGRRTQVLRCQAPDGTVIAKFGQDTREHDALAQLDPTGLAPRLLATDDEHLIVIMEDLAGTTLDAVLQGNDADAAEAGLFAFAHAFGAMHARTATSGSTVTIDAEHAGALWDFVPSEKVSVEVNALTQKDVGPDGCMLADGRARLFDFEIAESGAALTDVVLWTMGFPNCGATAGALPADLLRRMQQAYRESNGFDEAAFGHAYAACLLNRLERYHEWKVMEEDWVWGPASGRQRILWMLKHCPESAPLATEFASLCERLANEWPDTPDSLPIYPALSNPANK